MAQVVKGLPRKLKALRSNSSTAKKKKKKKKELLTHAIMWMNLKDIC
jgi:hypothetical protein